MRPLPGVDDQERSPTSHGSYPHTRNREKAQFADLGLRVGGPNVAQPELCGPGRGPEPEDGPAGTRTNPRNALICR
jgi:hypothetical protein